MDVSNLNIIPKSVINSVLERLGIKAKDDEVQAKKKTGLMDNITYLVIAIGAILVVMIALWILILLAKTKPKLQ